MTLTTTLNICDVASVTSSLAIVYLRKRELVAIQSYYCCHEGCYARCLFLPVSWVRVCDLIFVLIMIILTRFFFFFFFFIIYFCYFFIVETLLKRQMFTAKTKWAFRNRRKLHPCYKKLLLTPKNRLFMFYYKIIF